MDNTRRYGPIRPGIVYLCGRRQPSFREARLSEAQLPRRTLRGSSMNRGILFPSSFPGQCPRMLEGQEKYQAAVPRPFVSMTLWIVSRAPRRCGLLR
jgi:hypothetical protein